MKTITLKTDDTFFEKVNDLAKQLHLTKSELIRRSITEYESHIKKRAMKERMKEASLRVREANKEINDAFEITHEHLNDNTLAGMRMKNKNCFSVQYHPEASPGPHDSAYLFDQFIDMSFAAVQDHCDFGGLEQFGEGGVSGLVHVMLLL